MKRLIAAVILLVVFCSAAAFAANTPPAAPRHFASLRSGEVNMRTGPGTRYPIEWVYKRKGLPVEIIGEFEIWRRVRDSEGSEGWVHKSELTGRRMGVVSGTARNLLLTGDNGAAVVAHLENGAMGQILSCSPEWCRLKFDDVKGYLRKTEFWGADPDETFN